MLRVEIVDGKSEGYWIQMSINNVMFCTGDACRVPAGMNFYHFETNGCLKGWNMLDDAKGTEEYTIGTCQANEFGLSPCPWENRDAAHDMVAIQSPEHCSITKVSFMAQGGVSTTEDKESEKWMGVKLVDSSNGSVVRSYTRPYNQAVWEEVVWDKLPGKGCHKIIVQDGKGAGWGHIEVQDVTVWTKSKTDIVCPTNFAPVCGSDGQTYSNSCKAGEAGAKVASVGACLGETFDVKMTHYKKKGSCKKDKQALETKQMTLAMGCNNMDGSSVFASCVDDSKIEVRFHDEVDCGGSAVNAQVGPNECGQTGSKRVTKFEFAMPSSCTFDEASFWKTFDGSYDQFASFCGKQNSDKAACGRCDGKFKKSKKGDNTCRAPKRRQK
eukprot:TRINITY_DN1157_c0_g2_i2.p1 TRINITY_DN1157_c0_g2~~TRINITY_DN1157_c0_g2_i2.p1  ORF type:complete len:383 (+),score=79.14 TRINITY_DN1157_c0_g2_i2:224-1372(+)